MSDWKLVPDEPTLAMCEAYQRAMKDYIARLPEELRQRRKAYPRGYIVPEADKIKIRWKAMLAAAPHPRSP